MQGSRHPHLNSRSEVSPQTKAAKGFDISPTEDLFHPPATWCDLTLTPRSAPAELASIMPRAAGILRLTGAMSEFSTSREEESERSQRRSKILVPT